jgi:hypothetical protein
MCQECVQYQPSGAISPWLRYQDLEPIAVPPAWATQPRGMIVSRGLVACGALSSRYRYARPPSKITSRWSRTGSNGPGRSGGGT